MLKKLVQNILIVLFVVFILDFTIGKTLKYFYFKEASGLHYRTTYSIDTTKADILIFGSSRANHHYVPDVFEDSLKATFYNTGRDGNGTFYQLAMVNAILKRYIPKVIIFEYSSVFEKGQKEYDQMSSLLPYYEAHKEIRKIIELKNPFEKIKLQSQVYHFNSQFLTIAMGNLGINKKREMDNKGYVALVKEWEYSLDSAADYSVFDVDTVKISAFRECITIAKNSGAQVFVVYSPIFQKYNKNQEIDLCREICSSVNVPFWDFSKDIYFLKNRTLFQDILHLNNRGAIEFSKLVATKIKHCKEK